MVVKLDPSDPDASWFEGLRASEHLGYAPYRGTLVSEGLQSNPSLNGGYVVASKNFGENGKNKPAPKSDQVGKGDDASFRGYVNLSLTDLEKERYDGWADPTTVFTLFGDAVSAGVNVSVKREAKSAGFLASATQRDPNSVNAGLCVTARAKDAVTAFGRLMYVLSILSRSERWEDTAPLANPDRW